MRYLDTGARDPAETLAAWFQEVLQEPVRHLRLQTGFFVLDGLYPMLGVLDDLRTQSLPTSVLLGSNGGGTLRSDVEELAVRMGVPREHARLGIVKFSGPGFFHPKVYHLERADGTQAAYVGSANLTSSGLALHAEAGVALDSRHDDPAVLTKIASAIDNWFLSQQVGMNVVGSMADLDQLVLDGVLAAVPLPRVSSGGTKTNKSGTSQALVSLMKIPPVPRLVTPPPPPPVVVVPATTFPISAPAGTSPSTPVAAPPVAAPPATTPPVAAPPVAAPPVAVAAAGSRPVTNRPGFPQYLFFEPNAVARTVGIDALTGSTLPNGAVGLIVKLNQDSARHFFGGVGTSNISLPVATAFTLRFGVAGVHSGPTARFDLHMRYLGTGYQLRANDTPTSVKGYGYTAAETGHGDIRMVVTAEARRLKGQIQAHAGVIPSIDEFALLEWATDPDPTFKLSFMDHNSVLHQNASALYAAASAADQLVGNGACWLPTGLSPPW